MNEDIEIKNPHLCLSAPTAESGECTRGALPLVVTYPPDLQKPDNSSQGALPLVVDANGHIECNGGTQGALPPVVAAVGTTQEGYNRGGLKRPRTTLPHTTRARSPIPHDQGVYSLSGGRSGNLIFRLSQEKLEQAVSGRTGTKTNQ